MWWFIAGIAVASILFWVWGRSRSPNEPHTHEPPNPTPEVHQRLQELAQLTGELAHEIKNPLSTLKLNVRLVQEQLGEDPQATPQVRRARQKLTIIEEEADRLEKLLTGFLGYVRQPDCQWRTVDVSELVGEVVDFYHPQALQHRITLRHSLTSAPLPTRLDAAMFKQALLNLFINAQQAMPKGGELLVHTQREDTHARIQISDTGCGIAADKLPHLFTPYFSLRRKGTGLGLATVKKIVTLFSGTISVDSEPDQGTLFTIRLPLEQAEVKTQEIHN